MSLHGLCGTASFKSLHLCWLTREMSIDRSGSSSSICLSGRRDLFCGLRGCVCILNLWGESNNKVVRGVGRDPIGDACSKLETFSSRPQLRDVTSI